jgi:chromosome segregation ATPase
MRRDSLLRMAALLALAGFAALPAQAQQSPDQQSSDPVADAARKARAEKQAAAKPKKVYTDDDFASKKNAPATSAAGTGGDQASAKQVTADGTTATDASALNDPKSEASWRKRFQAVRDKIAASEKELDVLQRELDKDQVQYYSDPQKALMQQYDRKDINDRTAKVDAKKKEIDDMKKQLSDMEDELRKSGGDPGWAR